MNTGMADAYDLAGRLAAVTSGAADPSVLDGYDRERRAAATAVLAFTDRMTRVASLRSAPARALRNLGLRTLTRIPAARAAITLQVTGLARSPCGTEPSSRSPPPSPGGSHGHGRGRPDR
jgi:2-polyprenyl-6-methoxyphenol hydroxylase-like FAD-dependent oxidoreductase